MDKYLISKFDEFLEAEYRSLCYCANPGATITAGPHTFNSLPSGTPLDSHSQDSRMIILVALAVGKGGASVKTSPVFLPSKGLLFRGKMPPAGDTGNPPHLG